jgi:thiol-disulfide isomerase/thioredoxin
MSKQSTFAAFILAVVVLVGGLAFFMSKQASAPSKYDEFAKALKDRGAEFYGAFWCPHCQTEKALFGNAARYLPYIECSNPDRSQTPVCTDAKVESYPTWKFKDGITVNSKSTPMMCGARTETGATTPGEPAICAQVASQYYKTWIFPEYGFSIKSPGDPVSKDGVWKFPSGAATAGEIPLAFLAEQVNFTLPQ